MATPPGRWVSEHSDRFDQIPDCFRSFGIPSAYASPERVFEPQQLFLISFENCRMEADGLRSGRFVLQLLSDAPSFGIQRSRARAKYGWISVAFCCHVNQSGDFAVQVAKLLF
jgi:hypothetical protein